MVKHLYTIPGDGNCMFNAVLLAASNIITAHTDPKINVVRTQAQLRQLVKERYENEAEGEALRTDLKEAVVKDIIINSLSGYSTFSDEIDSLRERYECYGQDNLKATIESSHFIIRYIQKLVEDGDSDDTSIWGSYTELKILCTVLKVRISLPRQSITFGLDEDAPVIEVDFVGGNHYNAYAKNPNSDILKKIEEEAGEKLKFKKTEEHKSASKPTDKTSELYKKLKKLKDVQQIQLYDIMRNHREAIGDEGDYDYTAQEIEYAFEFIKYSKSMAEEKRDSAISGSAEHTESESESDDSEDSKEEPSTAQKLDFDYLEPGRASKEEDDLFKRYFDDSSDEEGFYKEPYNIPTQLAEFWTKYSKDLKDHYKTLTEEDWKLSFFMHAFGYKAFRSPKVQEIYTQIKKGNLSEKSPILSDNQIRVMFKQALKQALQNSYFKLPDENERISATIAEAFMHLKQKNINKIINNILSKKRTLFRYIRYGTYSAEGSIRPLQIFLTKYIENYLKKSLKSFFATADLIAVITKEKDFRQPKKSDKKVENYDEVVDAVTQFIKDKYSQDLGIVLKAHETDTGFSFAEKTRKESEDKLRAKVDKKYSTLIEKKRQKAIKESELNEIGVKKLSKTHTKKQLSKDKKQRSKDISNLSEEIKKLNKQIKLLQDQHDKLMSSSPILDYYLYVKGVAKGGKEEEKVTDSVARVYAKKMLKEFAKVKFEDAHELYNETFADLFKNGFLPFNSKTILKYLKDNSEEPDNFYTDLCDKLVERLKALPITRVTLADPFMHDLSDTKKGEFPSQFLATLLLSNRSIRRHIRNREGVLDYKFFVRADHTASWRLPASSHCVTDRLGIMVKGSRMDETLSLGSYARIYLMIDNIINAMNLKTKPDIDIAYWMRSILKGEDLEEFVYYDRSKGAYQFDNIHIQNKIRADLAKITYLLFGCEVVRNPASLIHNNMILDLIIEDKLTWKKAIDHDDYAVIKTDVKKPVDKKGKKAKKDSDEEDSDNSEEENEEEKKLQTLDDKRDGGLMPMSMKLAIAAARHIHSLFQAKMPYIYYYDPLVSAASKKASKEINKGTARVEELVKREAKLITKWIQLINEKNKKIKHEVSKQPNLPDSALEEMIKKAAQDWFGFDLSVSLSKTPSPRRKESVPVSEEDNGSDCLKQAEKSNFVAKYTRKPINMFEHISRRKSFVQSQALVRLYREADLAVRHDIELITTSESDLRYASGTSVVLLPESNHLLQHACNTNSLILQIKSGEIDPSTVICLERKQFGNNLGMRDVIFLAKILKHNETCDSSEIIEIPPKIRQMPIFYDAILCNEARAAGISIVGVEGKGLVTSKADLEHNHMREEAMAKNLEAIVASGKNPRLLVGSSHVERLQKRLTAKTTTWVEHLVSQEDTRRVTVAEI